MKLYHNGQLATNVTKQGGSGSLISDAAITPLEIVHRIIHPILRADG